MDGTNGNTYLKQVDGKLGETAIAAAGAIESQPGVKGRTVKLDVKIVEGVSRTSCSSRSKRRSR